MVFFSLLHHFYNDANNGRCNTNDGQLSGNLHVCIECLNVIKLSNERWRCGVFFCVIRVQSFRWMEYAIKIEQRNFFSIKLSIKVVSSPTNDLSSNHELKTSHIAIYMCGGFPLIQPLLYKSESIWLLTRLPCENHRNLFLSLMIWHKNTYSQYRLQTE